MKGVVQVRGDIGNPKGTGYAKITVDNLESADAAAALIAMDTFVDALAGNGFTECNVGNTSVTVYALQGAAKPGTGINVDGQLVVQFRNSGELRVRRLTIPGCDYDSAVLEDRDAGRRLTTAGAATLQGYIETLFAWGLDECVIIDGKWIGTR